MRKFLSKMFVCCCVCLMIVGCSKEGDESTGSIYGFVSDYGNANAPIAGATVTLNSKGQTKTTGSDGRFEFSNLEPGAYSLSVSANGYQTTSKQVSVRAGQSANCDFQLEVGRAEVDINPVSIVFGKDVEETSFSINNKSNRQLNYTISNYPNYINVTPASGTIAAKGEQAIRISVVNRKTISETKNGQITVNIGNDSYNISFNIEPYQGEMVSVDVNPQTLNFDKDTEKLTFTMTSNNSFDQNYQITSNLDILTVEPSSGTLTAKGQSTISVSVNDRKNVSNARNGQLTIDLNGSTFVVSVNVAKYEEGGDPDDKPDDTPSGEISTIRGLLLYYTFDNDNADNAYRDNDHGFIVENASFITDTPNGKGKAISLERENYIRIPSNVVAEKTAITISMWVKDFGTGYLFKTGSTPGWPGAPTLFINDDNTMEIYYNRWNSYTTGFSFQRYQSSGWHMLTFVYDSSNETCTILIDGRKVDTGSISFGLQTDGENMQIGGTDPMKVDNVRIHSVALEDKEIAEIYAAESK